MFCGKSNLITMNTCCTAVQSLETPRRFGCCCCCCCGVVAVAIADGCCTRSKLLSLRCVVCLSVCFSFSPVHPFCLAASSAPRWASPTWSPSRTSSAALLAARQSLRLPRKLRLLDASSIRIHLDLFHHATCLFDTSMSRYIESLLSSYRYPPARSSGVLPLFKTSASPAL